MEKIVLTANGDYEQLSLEQIECLFGCTSKEVHLHNAGLKLSLGTCQGGDRGSFMLLVASDHDDYERLVTLGDRQISACIWSNPDDEDDDRGGWRNDPCYLAKAESEM